MAKQQERCNLHSCPVTGQCPDGLSGNHVPHDQISVCPAIFSGTLGYQKELSVPFDDVTRSLPS